MMSERPCRPILLALGVFALLASLNGCGPSAKQVSWPTSARPMRAWSGASLEGRLPAVTNALRSCTSYARVAMPSSPYLR